MTVNSLLHVSPLPPVGLLHGDMSQGDRDTIITNFKKKEFPILVATDVAGESHTTVAVCL